MEVSRSGFYKWKLRGDVKNSYQLNREELGRLVIPIHKEHKTWGYRRLAKEIREKYGWVVSDYYVHLVCKELKIQSVVRRKRYKQAPGKKHKIYDNLIRNNWTVNRPFETVITDTTMIKNNNNNYDLTMYIDVFNNEILSYDLAPSKSGADPKSHNRALKGFIKKRKERGYSKEKTTAHSDQGVIYTSQAFSYHYKETDIKWSMSRAGTPTDNPIIESLNGWMKDELYIDYNLKSSDDVHKTMKEYIYYFNNERYANALGYKNPIQFRTELGFK